MGSILLIKNSMRLRQNIGSTTAPDAMFEESRIECKVFDEHNVDVCVQIMYLSGSAPCTCP